jgi:hypothetical protein
MSLQAMLDAAYASSLALIPAGPAKTQAINVGMACANSILTLRANKYRPGPLYRVDGKKYAEDFNEIKTLFSQAAEENALSRILVGFHFRNAIDRA